MSLQDSLFAEDAEYDVTVFARDDTRKRVLIFPPVNNYRRFIIHQLVQDRFPDLRTFSIGQADARRTVVCYKSDLIRDPKLNGAESKQSCTTRDSPREMGVEGQRSHSASPEQVRAVKSGKPAPKVEIYRPPAARRARNEQITEQTPQAQTPPQPVADSPSTRNNRQKRPDRAVYVPRHRRSIEPEGSPQPVETSRTSRASKDNNPASRVTAREESTLRQESTERLKKGPGESKESQASPNKEHRRRTKESSPDGKAVEEPCPRISSEEPEIQGECPELRGTGNSTESKDSNPVEVKLERTDDLSESVSKSVSESKVEEVDSFVNSDVNDDKERVERELDSGCENNSSSPVEMTKEHISNRDEIANQRNSQIIAPSNVVNDVLIISDSTPKKESKPAKEAVVTITPPEKKVKKVERPKSKPAAPPSPPVKINRDECDWDSLFDDNGDCLDPSLIEELTSAVGEVMVEQPKSDYKAYTRHVEVSSDEFAHVIEIYNFPSEFKTSDLAAVFSPFKNGGFELKWVDDTHCLGVFSSPLIAAEVLSSDHPFVKTRPLSEATALSKTKAKRIAEFLQPYRSRPETCAALARRLVTGALGVKLATARQEREHEKNVLREAKEKRRLANKQREDAWEGIIPEK